MSIDTWDRELELIVNLCRELAPIGLNVGLSDARPAAMVRTGLGSSLWITVDASEGFFEWHDAEERHPAADPAGAAARVAEYVKAPNADPDEAPTTPGEMPHHRQDFASKGASTLEAVVLGARAIPAVPAEVAGARHWLAGLLATKYASIVDDVVLLACELATNSILHSDSAVSGPHGEPGTVTLVVSATHDVVRVEVVDAGSATSAPHVIVDDGDAVNGRGLCLLAVMSDRWGTCADDEGRTTWFEIAAGEGGTPDCEGR